MLLMKESVLSLKEKKQNALKYQKYFMTNDLGIWLLDYRIKFSWLYNSQGYYYKSSLWLWSMDAYTENETIT